jgi:hypothetical protein
MNEPSGVELTRGGQKKLGSLAEMKDMIMAEAIRQRGGGQSQVSELRTDY